jgi:hypothetical protein
MDFHEVILEEEHGVVAHNELGLGGRCLCVRQLLSYRLNSILKREVRVLNFRGEAGDDGEGFFRAQAIDYSITGHRARKNGVGVIACEEARGGKGECKPVIACPTSYTYRTMASPAASPQRERELPSQ